MKILCFEIKYVKFRPNNWRNLAKDGKRIAAIKALYDKRNKNKKHEDKNFLFLRDAKRIVDIYMEKHNIKII